MYCPNCGTFYEEERRFCILCGVPLSTSNIQISPPVSPAKKGSHWVPILILIILSVLGTGLFFATAGLDYNISGGSCFQVRQGVLSFREQNYDGPEELSVPDLVDGQPVTEIGASCFAGCTDITTVIFPETVEAISSHAFKGCTSLRGINLPESVTFIGTGAFSGCSALEAVCIPGSTAYIAPDAFDNCTSLAHVFYAGTYTQWWGLYGPYMDENVNIYCSDGKYCQGVLIP